VLTLQGSSSEAVFLLQNSMFIFACSLRHRGGAGASSCSWRPGEAPTSAAQKRTSIADETIVCYRANNSWEGHVVKCSKRSGAALNRSTG
jgi:hypothetical protein